eukprot:scaffold1559_cov20-Cyclotella_meneghiniana.AAC.1
MRHQRRRWWKNGYGGAFGLLVPSPKWTLMYYREVVNPKKKKEQHQQRRRRQRKRMTKRGGIGYRN